MNGHPLIAYGIAVFLMGSTLMGLLIYALHRLLRRPPRPKGPPIPRRVQMVHYPCASCRRPIEDGQLVVEADDGKLAHLFCPRDP